jgi:hypothetical protein
MNPLDELKDIHLPASVDWWPLAPGWWVLATLILMVLALVVLKRSRSRKHRQLTQAAIVSLNQLAQDKSLDNTEWLKALSSLLRQIVINFHGREAGAGLVGEDWLAYLDQQGGGQGFSQGVGQVIASQPYQQASDYDREALLRLVHQWIKRQRRGGVADA